jgi:hypothetical protein
MQKIDYISLKSQLDANEKADFDFQQRRHSQWTENYQLYRDTVIINRLTQRQSINVPLMKGTIKTILANIDEFPAIEFEELDNNKDKEIVFNELWADFVAKDKLELKDIVDKKQVLLYGISWIKFNIVRGRITTEIKEPFDILVDRYADPADLDNTADHIIERGIYRTIDELVSNPMYDKEAIARLKLAYGEKAGLVKAEEITQQMQAKNQRLSEMGVPDLDNPVIGYTLVELKVHYKRIWDEGDKEFHWHAIVVCDSEVLSGKPMLEILGIDASPLVKWSDDPERNDQYPDGVADIVRNPNKLLNANISALAENRILRNYGMNFYDATANENWVPQSFEPMPGGWYPLPGKPGEVYQKVDVPDLSDSLDEMQYVQQIIESATAATAATKGDTEQKKVTLGEVELAVSAAKERINSTAKFYMLAQREKGDKWAKIVNANADKLEAVKLYKKSHKGNYFNKTVKGSDYKSDAGYTCRVVSSSEREKQGLETIQKLNAIKQDFPQNLAFKKIYDKKILEFGGLNPDEQKQVIDEEEQRMKQMQAMPGIPGAPGQPGQPVPQLTPPQNAFAPQPA